MKMLRVSDLEQLYDYSYWANRRLFAVIQHLTPEEFCRPVAGSYGSIRNTLVHVLSAEWGWLDRCGGPPRGPRLDPANYPTFESLDVTVQMDARPNHTSSSIGRSRDFHPAGQSRKRCRQDRPLKRDVEPDTV